MIRAPSAALSCKPEPPSNATSIPSDEISRPVTDTSSQRESGRNECLNPVN